MHHATYIFSDADHYSQEWTWMQDGKSTTLPLRNAAQEVISLRPWLNPARVQFKISRLSTEATLIRTE